MAGKADTIITQLRESIDYRERREYVRQLGRINTQASFEALVNCLDDTDEEVQQAAATALRKLKRPEAVESLLRPKILGSADPLVRWAAVSALGELGDHRVIEPLTRMLEDDEWVVRNQAAEAIRRRLTDLAERAWPEDVKLLIRMLVIDDPEVHEHTVSLLTRLGAGAVETLIDALGVPSQHVRLGAIDALGRMGDERAIPALLRMTAVESSAVRRHAVVALGKLKNIDALETLIMRLGDGMEPVAEAAIEAIQGFGPKTTPILIERLRHVRKRSMRKHIIIVLGRIADPRAVLPLLNTLSSSYYLIRSAAAEALIRYGTKVIDPVTELLMISEIPVEATIAEAEKQTNKRLRLRAIRALGELKNPLAIPTLKKLAQEDDREISTESGAALAAVGCCSWSRHMAAHILGEIADSRSIKPLMKALRDSSHHVRSAAIGALAKIGAREATKPLARVLTSDPEPAVRREAAIALGKLGVGIEEAADALIKALSDKSRRVRAHAARGQGRMGDPKAVLKLVRALDDSYWSVRSNAFNSLVSLGPVALPGLLEVLEKGSKPTRMKVLEVITEMGQPGAIEPLELIVKNRKADADFLKAAGQAIETLKAKAREA